MEFPVRVGVPPVVKGFTGREGVLDRLGESLGRGRVLVTQVLAGLGGAGKSQVAAAFVRDHQDEFDVVVWVRAESDPAVGFAHLGDRLGLAQRDGRGVTGEDRGALAVRAREWLGETDRDWLLVLDNVADSQTVARWTPATGSGRVIVTSRDHQIGGLAGVVRVDVFDTPTAVGFLLERTGSADEVGARGLADALGGLPLALAHAAAYCAANGTSFDQYRDLLGGLPARQLFGEDPAGAYEATVASTWVPSINAAEAWAPGARQALEVAAYLAPDAIPGDLLVPAGADASERHDRSEAVRALVELSLMTVAGDTTFDVHRLVQKVVRDTHTGRPAAAAVEALARIRAAWPDDHKRPGCWPVCETLLVHLDTVADHLDIDGDHADDLIRALNTASSWYHAAAPGAVDHATITVRRAERLLGAEHPDTLTARGNLALSYWSVGRTSEAIPIEEELAAVRERLLGAEHPTTLTTRANLAVSLQAAGRNDKALPIFEQVAADSERLLGAEHRDTLTARNSLAGSLRVAGRNDEALPIFEQVAADRERLLGVEHPDTLTARNNLAASLQAAGRNNDALPIREQVAADLERLLGVAHPDTLGARANLAGSLRVAGRNDEALPIYQQVAADLERLLGVEHPDTLTARNNLAGSLRVAGRNDEALPIYQRVAAGRERLLGVEHPATLTARNNLAGSLQAAGRNDEALPIYQQVAAGRERLLGVEHPDTLTARRLRDRSRREGG